MLSKQRIAQNQSVAIGLDVDYQGAALAILNTVNGETLYEGRLARTTGKPGNLFCNACPAAGFGPATRPAA
ncbi:MAG TPA: hypothetical protein VF398_04390 [bacterium]|jgi:hypothetical protein